MSDKRKDIRHKKRLRLKFGREAATNVAYTEDISMTGLFIKSPNVIQPGNRISIELEMPDTNPVVMEGIVMWAKRVPLSMIHRINKSGMGIKIMRISSGSSTYFSYAEALASTDKKRIR